MSDGTRNPGGFAEGRDDWEALARYLAGESPPEEARAIRRMLDARRDDATLVAALDRAMKRVAFTAPPDLDVERALRSVKTRIQEDADVEPTGPRLARPIVRPISRWRVARSGLPALAAAVVLMVGLAIWGAVRGDRSAPGTGAITRMHATLIGQTDSLRLADGSLVVLAPSSRLTIPSDFGATRREVTLEGEAYFDVVHDSTVQFVVRAGAATVRDLGTAFTVRSAGSDSVVVAVTSGSVLLRAAAASDDRGVLLRAGDRGAVRRDGSAVAERGVVTSDAIAWTRGRLVFRGAPLADVRNVLHRWYGIELQFADSTLATRRIDIDLTGEPAARALELLALTLGAEVERRGDTAVVRVRPDARAR